MQEHMCMLWQGTVLLEDREVQMEDVATNETQDMSVQMHIKTNNMSMQAYEGKPLTAPKHTTYANSST